MAWEKLTLCVEIWEKWNRGVRVTLTLTTKLQPSARVHAFVFCCFIHAVRFVLFYNFGRYTCWSLIYLY